MAKGLKLAEPPQRRTRVKDAVAETPEPSVAPEANENASPAAAEQGGISPTLFAQLREADMVQFNRRVEKGVADGYALLAIRTGKKVPDLLKEGLEELQKRYGKI